MTSLKQPEFDRQFYSFNTRNRIFDFKIMQHLTKKINVLPYMTHFFFFFFFFCGTHMQWLFWLFLNIFTLKLLLDMLFMCGISSWRDSKITKLCVVLKSTLLLLLLLLSLLILPLSLLIMFFKISLKTLQYHYYYHYY